MSHVGSKLEIRPSKKVVLAWAAATSALSTAKRSYPTSEVRGRSREDPMPEGQQPRGFTPRPRSGGTAESARLRRRRNGQEELLHVQQGWQPRRDTQRPRSGAATKGVTLRPRSGATAERSYPTSKIGVAAGWTNPMSKERWLHGHRRT